MKPVYTVHPWEIEKWPLQGVDLYIGVKFKGKCNLGKQEVVFI